MIEFPSEEWINEFCRRINQNEEYREKGSEWGVDFNGDFVFVIEPDDGLDEHEYFFIGFEGGECTGARKLDDPDEVEYGFKYIGEYSNWKKLVEGAVGPIDGLMTGKFGLEGDMSKVLEFNESAQIIIEEVEAIDVEYR